VGKTTLSAALALKLAAQGYKTIVLTIDPAKRLANSLGLKHLGDTPQRIELPRSLKTRGELDAMMLDTKRTFDRIVEKYSPTRATAEKIFANKVYQHLSQMLAGSQEYMAMERLYEIWQQNSYERIIIDTPPMQNAVEFLEAPKRMNDMISNSMLHLLLKPSMALGKRGLKLFERGSQQILKIFDRIIGFAFLQDISEMLIAFQDLIGGFQSRANDVKKLLGSTQTRFVAVCTTHAHSVAETKYFKERLAEDGYSLFAVLANRVHAGPALSEMQMEHDQKKLLQTFSRADSEILIGNYNHHLPLIKRDEHRLKRLADIAGTAPITALPLFDSDIHDLTGLAKIGEFLCFKSSLHHAEDL
jgi:anion-transporting  ArsA/GET3 family ATPase